ncbi:MAG: hypothetical protein ACOYEA_06365 [Fermentimonas sp.]|jgi:hypothetical protein
MKKWLVLASLMLCLIGNAQTANNLTISNKGNSNYFDKSKLRFGAGLGLSTSRNYTYLGLGPQVGYLFNKHFMAGAGANYYYTKVNHSDYRVTNSLLGANIFAYTYPVSFITIFAQPELNYIWSTTKQFDTDQSETVEDLVPSLVIGAGLRLGGTHVTLNYDVIQNSRSPHPEGFYLGVSAFF